ncbi:hypothetical protein [Algivirga pacifica]|uniref:Riboflavin synthase subunit beta n=1 Tax=Algivirga pacifica TaxID=1162670 RepID=A0ABP9DBY5_9BACT
MRKFKFMFRLPDNRHFDYEPMYYDEAKERREQKKKEYEALLKGEKSEELMEGIRERIRFSSNRSRSQDRSSIIMRLSFVIILSILTYWIFVNFV